MVIGAGFLALATIPIWLVPMVLFGLGYWIPAILIILIYYIFNAIALNGVYNNKRSDIQTKITWTFVEIVFPGAGAYVYFVFARVPKKIKKDLKKSEILENELLPKNIDNSEIEIIDNGYNKFQMLFEELSKAKKYINIQYFIINPGIIHNKLFDILKKKADEGVKIKILYDYLGTVKWSKKDIEKINGKNIEISEFRKIKWSKGNGSDNWRSHNKIILIDGEKVFFGGNNIGDEYLGLSGKYGDWIDAHYYAVGDIVKSYNAVFISQWFIATNKDISNDYIEYNNLSKGNSNNLEMLIDSPNKDIPITFKRIKQEIRNSKKSIKIITPYVAFPISFKDTIRDAVERGIDIEFITIGRADKKSAYYQASFDIDTLTDFGVKVYRINNIFIHTKMYIFDNDRVIFGTSNLDYRALFQHFETNVLIAGKQTNDFTKYFNYYKKFGILNETSRNNWSIGKSLTYFFLRIFKGLF